MRLFPGHIGAFAGANTARVFVDGEEGASKWHPSYAGGLMLTAFDHASAFHFGVGDSPDSGVFVMFRGTAATSAIE